MSVSEEPPVVVRVFACTDVGRTREHNEDSFVVADLATPTPLTFSAEQTHTPGDRGELFMVADGMGGAAAGEIASSMAVDVVLQELRARWTGAAAADPPTFVQALIAATAAANERIHRYATEHAEFRGMGTTATVAGVLHDTLYIAQVGDSRAYIVRHGEAQQLTKDQSLMQRLIEAGEITAEEAEVSERRNIILQALGPEATIKVDVTHQLLRRGDTLVLCSDGLSGLVRHSEIAQAVVEETDLHALCTRLIDTANAKGGPDNITVVAARFDGPGLADAATGDAVGHQVFPVGESPPESAVTRPTAAAPRPAAAAPTESERPVDTPRRSPSVTTLEIAPRRAADAAPAAARTIALVLTALGLAVLVAEFLLARRPP
jgi:serine/threonine protein phosphatase PrpC